MESKFSLGAMEPVTKPGAIILEYADSTVCLQQWWFWMSKTMISWGAEWLPSVWVFVCVLLNWNTVLNNYPLCAVITECLSDSHVGSAGIRWEQGHVGGLPLKHPQAHLEWREASPGHIRQPAQEQWNVRGKTRLRGLFCSELGVDDKWMTIWRLELKQFGGHLWSLNKRGLNVWLVRKKILGSTEHTSPWTNISRVCHKKNKTKQN